ncbi:hypothetical protein L6452_01754 [Arctium lappa]|uniref:Uncharacterized protein n=1 Tax=Arctium lappa TaxID=4217 RepID=A0ACB9FHM0_ARCLA|nr:hypothetical protein L6452_01754 [Arctium lappa]
MEKDKSPNVGGILLPPSGRHLPCSRNNNNLSVKSEGDGSSEGGGFGHDVSRMPDNPPKTLGHRCAHSEILTLPDDISFDSDLGVVGGGFDGPSFSDETEEDLFSMYLDMDKFNFSSATSTVQATSSSSAVQVLATPLAPSSERPRVRHQHSQSMDDFTTIKPEMLTSAPEETSPSDKKAISAAKLVELALVDPKRAKR